jgi:phospholipase C
VLSPRLAIIALLVLALLPSVLSYAVPTKAGASPSQQDELSKIQHIVIIVQENRSFNNLFYGYPGAVTQKTGKCGSTTIPIRQVALATEKDVSHGIQDAKTAYDQGKMDGFCQEFSQLESPSPDPQYAYVSEKQVAPYWEMAKEYVLADHMFSSQLDGSFVGHQYIVAGWAGDSYNIPSTVPWGCDDAPGATVGIMNGIGQPVSITPPCFTYKSIANELDAKSVSWHAYAPKLCPNSPSATNCATGYSWTGFDAIKSIREGPDWKKDVITPETRVLQDVKNGYLADVTWVIPSEKLSDHAGNDSNRGPSWVTAVVNAVGESKFWPSTAIFVTWDDWGGWYDGVRPPSLGWNGLGMRVPLICISPYAKANHVDHAQYEFGSLLKFIESRYGLPSLGESDARSAAPLGCFDFSQSPRSFEKIDAPYSVRDVMAHVTNIAPDDQ